MNPSRQAQAYQYGFQNAVMKKYTMNEEFVAMESCTREGRETTAAGRRHFSQRNRFAAGKKLRIRENTDAVGNLFFY